MGGGGHIPSLKGLQALVGFQTLGSRPQPTSTPQGCGDNGTSLILGGTRGGGGWLVGWLLPLCPGARPGPPRLEATGGRGCVTRCASHVPRALGLTRAAPARSHSVPPPVSGTPGSTASRAAPCPTVPCFCGCAAASVLCPPPCLWCVRRASRGFLPASAGQGVSCRFALGAGWARRLALGAGPGALVPPPPRGPRVLLAPSLSGGGGAKSDTGGGGRKGVGVGGGGGLGVMVHKSPMSDV